MLTDLRIEKLTIPTARLEIPDGKIGGLYLVVQPSGVCAARLRPTFGSSGSASK